MYIDPKILLNYYKFIPGKTIERYLLNSRIFPKFRCLLYQSVFHRLRFYHCVFAGPIISQIVRFFHSFVDSCIGTICHHKDFTGQVLLWEKLISPWNNLFHTKKDISGKVQLPKWAPFAPSGTSNQIAGKSWNQRGQQTRNRMARKPWYIAPKCEIKSSDVVMYLKIIYWLGDIFVISPHIWWNGYVIMYICI